MNGSKSTKCPKSLTSYCKLSNPDQKWSYTENNQNWLKMTKYNVNEARLKATKSDQTKSETNEIWKQAAKTTNANPAWARGLRSFRYKIRLNMTKNKQEWPSWQRARNWHHTKYDEQSTTEKKPKLKNSPKLTKQLKTENYSKSRGQQKVQPAMRWSVRVEGYKNSTWAKMGKEVPSFNRTDGV